MQINFDDSRLMAKLAALEDAGQDKAVDTGLQRGAQLVERYAKQLVPVDSAELRNSIHTKVERDGEVAVGYVYTDSDHAAFVEFGTGQRGMAGGGDGSDTPVSYREDWAGMHPQPYLYPAAAGARDQAMKAITDGIRSAVRKLAKGG